MSGWIQKCFSAQKHSPHIEKATFSAITEKVALAQKEGFEPSRRFTQPTPLAGEPLRPLGYFCKTYMI